MFSYGHRDAHGTLETIQNVHPDLQQTFCHAYESTHNTKRPWGLTGPTYIIQNMHIKSRFGVKEGPEDPFLTIIKKRWMQQAPYMNSYRYFISRLECSPSRIRGESSILLFSGPAKDLLTPL